MDILIDLSINLIAALVGFGIGWLWKEIRKKIKTRRARIFWKPFVSGELQVVIGRFSEFKAFERSGFIGIGSAMGLTELYNFFKKIGLHDFTVLYSDLIEGNSLKTNLILLGGPDANSISREALSRIKSTIKLGDPDLHEISIQDTKFKKLYSPRIDENSNKLRTDYGLILKTKNPFNHNKQLLLIAGSFGYGTWAGIRYITSKEFLKNRIVSEGTSLECLIETDITLETPQQIKLITLRPIEQL